MNKLFTKLLFMLLLVAGASWQALAQSQVSGTVKDQSGAGLPGINVLEKGTTNGTVTDGTGKYTLALKSSNAVLVISSIGYKTQEVAVGGQSTLDITAEEDIALLSDVVVVGYGEQEKKDVTGAMATLKSTDFNAGAIASPEQLFQGKLSGVLVVQNSGEPGGGVSINIRGANSVRASNNPLFVVDGFPLDGRDVSSAGINLAGLGGSSARNPLNFINPDDIESIDVLKDASATAIYGSRGANGVVLITTKKAKVGESNFNVSSFAGIATVSKKLDLLERDAFLAGVAAAGGTPQNFGANTDWQDEVYRSAITNSHGLSFSKGTEKGAYRISMNYFDQDGVVEKSNLKRITTRINASQELIKDRLNIDYQLTFAHVRDVSVPISNNAGFQGSLIGAALQSNPTLPVRNPNGSFVQRGDNVNGIAVADSYTNPMALLAYIDDQTQTNRVLGNIGLTLNIAKGLDFRTTVGVDNSGSQRRVTVDPRLRQEASTIVGSAGIANINLGSVLTESFLTYKTNIGEGKLTALLGYSYQAFNAKSNLIAVVGTTVPNTSGLSLGADNIGFGTIDVRNRPGSTNQTNYLQSFFGRVNYSFRDKYLITATLRSDGSSRFGANNRYGYFPSLAAAWRLSEEDFIPEVFYDLKLRAGWGATGNQEIPNGATKPLFTVDPGNGEATQVGLANQDIKWEQTTQWNVGVDFAFAKGRISGTLDYYDKRTTNLLLQLPVPAPTFVANVWRNLDAVLINQGIELAVSGLILTGANNGLRWNVDANFTYFTKNKITDLAPTTYNTGTINGQGLSNQFAQRLEDGQPLFSFYVPTFTGFNASGDAQFANGGARSFVGGAQPDYIYGLTSNLSYKNFDFTLNFNGRGGSYVYNNTANALFNRPTLRGNRNITVAAANSGENPAGSPTVSTLYLEKGDFFRLNNATVGYNVKTANSQIIKNLRFYISGQNLFVITKYTGYDPEVNVDKNINGIPSLGIDYTGFPRNRTLIVGAQIGF
jgi:TonB-dependent starch-binding outer membrane protein SusC